MVIDRILLFLKARARITQSDPHFQCRPKAKAARRARGAFLKRTCKHRLRLPSLHTDIRCRNSVETSEKELVQFKGWVVGSKEFSENEKAAFKVDSVAAFSDYWQKTNSAKEDFDRSHEKGCGLWAKRYQSSAAFVQPFMDDFSPIVEIVKDFGAPYGGVAVGTISLLFAVSISPGVSIHFVPRADTTRRWQGTRMQGSKV